MGQKADDVVQSLGLSEEVKKYKTVKDKFDGYLCSVATPYLSV